METDFDNFKCNFGMVVSFMNLLIDSKRGFITDILVEEQQLSRQDSDKLLLINIEKAYLDESPYNGHFKRNIILKNKML